MSRRGLSPRTLVGVALPQRRLRPWAVGAGALLPDTLNVAASTIAAEITATASATPHVKGAWVEVVASLSADSFGVIAQLAASTFQSATDSSMLLDIGVGGAGSETVVVADYPIGYRTTTIPTVVPLFIPAGSRVAVRAQSVVASKTAVMRMAFFARDATAQPASSTITAGADTSTSRGTVVAYPGTINTKSSWVELTSAASTRLSGICLGVQGASDTAWSGTFLLDIGVGGAGSETVVVADLAFEAGSTESVSPFVTTGFGAWGATIPAGARIAARAQFSSATISGIDVAIIGIPWRA